MQLTLRLTGTRAKNVLGGYSRNPETEEYTHAEIESMSGSNRAVADVLRSLANDIDPNVEVSS